MNTKWRLCKTTNKDIIRAVAGWPMMYVYYDMNICHDVAKIIYKVVYINVIFTLFNVTSIYIIYNIRNLVTVI